MVRPITLLHLSDLRFGFGHPCGRLAPPSVDDTAQAAALLLLTDLGRVQDEEGKLVQPDLVVLSGDLTNEGRPSEFRDLFSFVDVLAQGLEIPRNRVVVVPGNRDVSREACAAYFSSCTAEEVEPRLPYWPKWRFFSRFFKDLYADHPEITFTESEPWSIWELPDLKLTVAGLNSTYAESHLDGDHYGLLGDRQLVWFGRELEEAKQREWLRIAVLHHDLRAGIRLGLQEHGVHVGVRLASRRPGRGLSGKKWKLAVSVKVWEASSSTTRSGPARAAAGTRKRCVAHSLVGVKRPSSRPSTSSVTSG